VRQKKSHIPLGPLLILLLVVCVLLSVCFGGVSISFGEVFSSVTKFISGQDDLTLNERILSEIRVPRVFLSVIVGAGLTIGGVLCQSLFRNPIVEPGLIGTSSGAAFGASVYYVLSAALHLNFGSVSLSIMAFLGGILSTGLVLLFSGFGRSGEQRIFQILLTGMAINALFLAGVGFLSYIARDPQARSITFWNLGTLSGANWHSVSISGFILCVGMFASLWLSKHLNALMLGYDEALLLGTNIKKIKYLTLIINVLIVTTITSFVGVIAFVGLIVPHILRLMLGTDNRKLIIYGSLFGASLLCISDLIARIIIAPAELPVGIITAVTGVPVFLILLNKNKTN
jgi:iron complex transport system permease protein